MDYNSGMARRKPFGRQELGVKLFFAREAAGITLAALGETVGASRQQVHRWEQGGRVPSALALRALAVALGVSTDYLLGLAGWHGCRLHAAAQNPAPRTSE